MYVGIHVYTNCSLKCTEYILILKLVFVITLICLYTFDVFGINISNFDFINHSDWVTLEVMLEAFYASLLSVIKTQILLVTRGIMEKIKQISTSLKYFELNSLRSVWSIGSSLFNAFFNTSGYFWQYVFFYRKPECFVRTTDLLQKITKIIKENTHYWQKTGKYKKKKNTCKSSNWC